MIDRAGRIGYFAKGIVYLLLGMIALRGALTRAQPTDTRGTLHTVNGGPFGGVLLSLIAAGLALYALWRAYMAVRNPEGDCVPKRVFHAGVFLINAALALEAGRLALARLLPLNPGAADGNQAQHWSAELMRRPFGAWIVGFAGLGIGVYGAWLVARGARSDLDSHLRLSEVEPDRRALLKTVSRIGISARGVVFVLIAIFLVQAALHSNPGEAKDFGESLRELRRQQFGSVLLAIVAVGLCCYGVYEIVRARYRTFSR